MKQLLIALCLALPLAAVEPGFTPLFNGRDLTGWTRVNGHGEFKVEDGCIVGFGENVQHNTFLRTDKTYRDFDFRFEFKFDDLTGNSGMMFRGLQRPGDDGRVFGYQCEHDNGKGRAWTAGLYDEARRGWLVPDRDNAAESKAFTEQGQKLKKWDDWNEVRIACKGNRIRIWLNGELRVDYADEGEDATAEGFFGLQVHSGKSCKVRWRNLRIKEL
jgi:hypothetical protein